MAWTEQLRSGRWRGGYRVPGGEKRYTPETFVRERDAQRKASALEEESRELGWRDPRAGERTWGDWCEEWLRGHYVERSTHTRTMSMIRSRIMPKWGNTPLIEIDRHQLRIWALEMQDDGLAATSAKRVIAAFSTSLSAAVDAGVIAANPAFRLNLRIPDNLSERTLTGEEQHRLFAAFEPQHEDATDEEWAIARRDQALVAVLLGAGPRWGEAVALGPEHIHRAEESIRWRRAWDAQNRILKPYTKGKKRRTTPIAEWLLGIIDPVLSATAQGEFLFTSSSGQPLDYSNWRRRSWEPAVERARLNDGYSEDDKATIHTLRHTYATALLDAGFTIAEVATLLGHASLSTAERYAHRRSKVRQEAANAVSDPRIRPATPTPPSPEVPDNVIRFPGAS
ncbi:hypothetical protein H490_0104080 [Leucobacter sp. UCD-THU]|uniref:tyrosine-type recombinase/integrase n=1 Tax=Leucobacter sp. UCD-THU TaxID=1292023 RepID=UPI000360F922|nr:tyrosine-type recombinase/integrase [Leucobacter sp. UCD-THU]EYT56049.1 hypothetical protein H490_0104080 [Leucobacter sp. UCD-THU]